MGVKDFRIFMGRLIREARKRQGLSLRQAARDIGFNEPTTLWKVEHGEMTVPWTRIDRFEKVFNFQPGFLLSIMVNWKRGVPPDPYLFREARSHRSAARARFPDLLGSEGGSFLPLGPAELDEADGLSALFQEGEAEPFRLALDPQDIEPEPGEPDDFLSDPGWGGRTGSTGARRPDLLPPLPYPFIGTPTHPRGTEGPYRPFWPGGPFCFALVAKEEANHHA